MKGRIDRLLVGEGAPTAGRPSGSPRARIRAMTEGTAHLVSPAPRSSRGRLHFSRVAGPTVGRPRPDRARRRREPRPEGGLRARRGGGGGGAAVRRMIVVRAEGDDRLSCTPSRGARRTAAQRDTTTLARAARADRRGDAHRRRHGPPRPEFRARQALATRRRAVDPLGADPARRPARRLRVRRVAAARGVRRGPRRRDAVDRRPRRARARARAPLEPRRHAAAAARRRGRAAPDARARARRARGRSTRSPRS